VLIRVWIERSQPLAGTAAAGEAEPLHFDGWLELLRVISELVAACPSDGSDIEAAEEHARENQTGMTAGCKGCRPGLEEG
jgi:hypothetical protein